MNKEFTNMIARKGLEATAKAGLKRGNLVGNPKQLEAAAELLKIDPSKLIATVSMTMILDEEKGGFRVIGIIAGDETQIRSLDILSHNAVDDALKKNAPTFEETLAAMFGAEIFNVDVGLGDETIEIDSADSADICPCPGCIARRERQASEEQKH